MRILYLNPSGELGGAERVLLDIFRSLKEAEPDWSLHLITSDQGPLINEAKALNIHSQVCYFPLALARLGDTRTRYSGQRMNGNVKLLIGLLTAVPSVRKYVKELRSLIDEINPDIIHSNGLKMHILSIRAVRGRIPVLWHIHEFIQSRPVTSRLLRRYSSRCSGVIANSKSVQEDLVACCGNELKIRTIYNAVDLNRFTPTGNVLDLDALAGFPPTDQKVVRIGLLGTFGIWKGHKIFLQALARLPDELPFRAYMIGGPVYQTDGSQFSIEELRDLARQLGIGHRVGFTGFVEDSPAAIRALDILVHASTQPEPFGLVIVEAMACKKPVIASNSGGASEIIRDKENGLGHGMGDVQGLATLIIQLIRDPQQRSLLGAAGRRTAEMYFDRSRFAKELIPFYLQALTQKQ